MLFTLGLLYGNAADVAINDTLGVDNIIQSSYMYDDSSFGVSIRKHAPPLIKTVDLKRKTQGHLPDHGRVTLQPRYNISRPINKKIDDLLNPCNFFLLFTSLFTKAYLTQQTRMSLTLRVRDLIINDCLSRTHEHMHTHIYNHCVSSFWIQGNFCMRVMYLKRSCRSADAHDMCCRKISAT